MLKRVEVYSLTGDFKLNLPVAEADPTSRYLVGGIDGLGPVKATIATASYAYQDGVGFLSAKTEARNMNLVIGYRPDFSEGKSYQTLRRELYRVFPNKQEVRLLFHSTDMPTVEITAMVEDHAPVLFSKTPAVQITLLAFKPYFKDTGVVTESLDPSGDSATSNFVSLTNTGDVATGVVITFELGEGSPATVDDMTVTLTQRDENGNLSNVVFINNKLRIISGGRLTRSDSLLYSSVVSEKKAELIRSSGVTNVVGAAVDNQNRISWFVIPPGVTREYRYAVSNSAIFPYTTATLSYRPLYEGI